MSSTLKHSWCTRRWHDSVSKLIFWVEPLRKSDSGSTWCHITSLSKLCLGTNFTSIPSSNHLLKRQFFIKEATRCHNVFSRLIVALRIGAYTMFLALKSFFSRDCWFSSSFEIVKLVRLITWHFSCLRKTSRYFVVVILVSGLCGFTL